MEGAWEEPAKEREAEAGRPPRYPVRAGGCPDADGPENKEDSDAVAPVLPRPPRPPRPVAVPPDGRDISSACNDEGLRQ
jgi:hypothetical protein